MHLKNKTRLVLCTCYSKVRERDLVLNEIFMLIASRRVNWAIVLISEINIVCNVCMRWNIQNLPARNSVQCVRS